MKTVQRDSPRSGAPQGLAPGLLSFIHVQKVFQSRRQKYETYFST